MPDAIRRAAAVWLVAGGLTAIGPAALAQATDASISATVRGDVPRITASQAHIDSGLARFEKSHSPTALISAVRAQNRTLSALRRRLAGQAPSSARGRRGKLDIVRGLTLIIRSNQVLIRDLHRSAHGKPTPRRELLAAVSADKRGNRDINAGARLLHV